MPGAPGPATTELGPHPAGAVDDGRHDDRFAAAPRRRPAELGPGLLRHRLDEDVEVAAAGQADREGVVVGDPVPLQDRPPVATTSWASS